MLGRKMQAGLPVGLAFRAGGIIGSEGEGIGRSVGSRRVAAASGNTGKFGGAARVAFDLEAGNFCKTQLYAFYTQIGVCDGHGKFRGGIQFELAQLGFVAGHHRHQDAQPQGLIGRANHQLALSCGYAGQQEISVLVARFRRAIEFGAHPVHFGATHNRPARDQRAVNGSFSVVVDIVGQLAGRVSDQQGAADEKLPAKHAHIPSPRVSPPDVYGTTVLSAPGKKSAPAERSTASRSRPRRTEKSAYGPRPAPADWSLPV